MNDDQVLRVLACPLCPGQALRHDDGYRCEDCGAVIEGQWLLSRNPDVPPAL